MSDDIVARLCSWAEGDCVYHESVPDMLEAADEIERLRKERDGIDWKHRALCAEANLARYKRMYARSCCAPLYSSGLKWRTRPNPMRTDGVFIEEDCEPGQGRAWWPFPHQFEESVANEIVELLNRATEERKQEERC
jgi:hypothetical protein